MRLVPVAALVDEATMEALRPSIEAVAARVDLNETELEAGWTSEALALGVFLSRLADAYEVVPS